MFSIYVMYIKFFASQLRKVGYNIAKVICLYKVRNYDKKGIVSRR